MALTGNEFWQADGVDALGHPAGPTQVISVQNVADFIGSTAPNVSNATGTLAVAHGGTGQTTALAARGSSGLNIDEMTLHGDSAYVILSTDRTVATNAAFTAARIWTLPAASSINAGQALTVADKAGGITSTNTLTISRAGSDTLNNTTTVVMNVPYQTVTVVSDGVSAWTITANQSGGGGSVPTNDRFDSTGISVSGGGVAPATGGVNAFFTIPYAGTITGWALEADASGSIVVDVWKRSGAIPTVANTIVASAPPTLSSQQYVNSTTITGWTTAVAVGDVFGYSITSASTLTKFTLQIFITRT